MYVIYLCGHLQMAVGLTNVIQPDPPCPPSDRLYNVVMLGLEREAEIIEERKRINKEKILRNPTAPQVNNGLLTDVGIGIDLEFEVSQVIFPMFFRQLSTICNTVKILEFGF